MKSFKSKEWFMDHTFVFLSLKALLHIHYDGKTTEKIKISDLEQHDGE